MGLNSWLKGCPAAPDAGIKISFFRGLFMKKSKKPLYPGIDQVERITGYDFFPALPDEVDNRIEKEYELKYWR